LVSDKKIVKNELNYLFTATPPNAIVFSSGAIRVIDMVMLIFD
jgi:hypothetical protein